MEDIINNLKDPSWWFTAIFVAILAGVVAGFLKDKITSLIGNLSSSLREWKELKDKEEDQIIEVLINNETYFNIALFRVLIALILFAISVVIYSTSPVLLSMVPEDKEPFIPLPVDRAILAWKIIMPLLGTLSILIGYKASSRISLVYKAIKRYREAHDLPKLP